VRRGLLVVGALMIAAACSSFDEANDSSDAGPATDGGPTSDANVDAATDAIAVMCLPEEIGTQKHCGRCGRDCGEGSCVDGDCTAYRVQPAAFPWYVAVDGTDVYWTSHGLVGGSGDVVRAPKLGGGAALSIWNSPGVFDVAVNGGSVFVTVVNDPVEDGVFVMQTDGGGRGKLAGVAVELVVGGAFVYTVTRSVAGSDIQMLELTKSAARVLASVPNENRQPEGLAVDGTNLYFLDHQPNGRIERVALASPTNAGVVATVITTSDTPRRLAADATHLFWTSDSMTAPGIRRTEKGGGKGAEIIATNDIHYGRVIVDATHLYATVQNEGTVLRMDKDGTNVKVLKNGLDGPVGLTQDKTAIYFAEHGAAGGIWRVVK
jgi:hypothetical protein